MQLPTINGTNPHKINEFYDNFITRVKKINGYPRFTFNKLAGITGDLVRTDKNWENWTFSELIKGLTKWNEINPVNVDQQRQLPKKSRLLQAR